ATVTAVLIVDDDPSKRKLIRGALESLGVSGDLIAEESDAASARRTLLRYQFDLLLLDILLPLRSDSPPSAESSIDLLRQIVEDQMLPAPRYVVGITADAAA